MCLEQERILPSVSQKQSGRKPTKPSTDHDRPSLSLRYHAHALQNSLLAAEC